MSQCEGNQCGCGRMIFSIQEIAVSDPEDRKVTVILGDVVLATCVGCGAKLLIGKGQFRFIPVSPTSSAGREILRDSVNRALYPEPEIEPVSVKEPEAVGASS